MPETDAICNRPPKALCFRALLQWTKRGSRFGSRFSNLDRGVYPRLLLSNHQPQNDRISGRLGEIDSFWLQIRHNFRPYLSLSFGTREIYSFSCKYLSFPKNSWNISLYFFSFPIHNFEIIWHARTTNDKFNAQNQIKVSTGAVYVRELIPTRVPYRDDHLISYRVEMKARLTLITHALPVSANREVKSYKNERLFCVYMTLLRDFVPEWNSPSGTEIGVNWHPYDIFW